MLGALRLERVGVLAALRLVRGRGGRARAHVLGAERGHLVARLRLGRGHRVARLRLGRGHRAPRLRLGRGHRLGHRLGRGRGHILGHLLCLIGRLLGRHRWFLQRIDLRLHRDHPLPRRRLRAARPRERDVEGVLKPCRLLLRL